MNIEFPIATQETNETKDTEQQKMEDHVRSLLPIDNDEHLKMVATEPAMRRAVTLVMRRELKLDESKAKYIMMILRKFLFADSYLLVRTPKASRQTKRFQLPCSITPLLNDVYEEVIIMDGTKYLI